MLSMKHSYAFVFLGTTFVITSTMTSPATAQQQGDVRIKPATQSAIQSLDNLERLLLAPPEEVNTINFYVTPQYRRDRYDSYSEVGRSFSRNSILEPERPIEIESPDFNVDSTGISFGADYLLDGHWLLGGQLSFTNADFNYEVKPDSDFVEPRPDSQLNNELLFGDPIEREFDEYGVSFSLGYVTEPWTALATIGYSRRDTKLETLKVATFLQMEDNSAGQLQVVEADFTSDIYTVDLGASYRLKYGGISLQPYGSIGYQIEQADGYSEVEVSARNRQNINDQTFDDLDLSETTFRAGADVDGQTIRSIPGRIGVLLSTPFNLPEKVTRRLENAGNWRFRAGLSFTHDFDDQKRRIRGVRRSEGFSADYIEKNRNRNFFSLTAGLGFEFAAFDGSLNYQRDIGFDERKSADVISLQLRIPLPY